MNLGHARPVSRRASHGIDRMIQNVETGRFERSLSALTAAGALVTAAEIFFEHDSASFGDKMMWIPVTLGPVRAEVPVYGSGGFTCYDDRQLREQLSGWALEQRIPRVKIKVGESWGASRTSDAERYRTG